MVENIFQEVANIFFSGPWEVFLKKIEELRLWQLLSLFIISSFLMIWRLGAMENKGIEGTVLGALVMPYCSGLSNLVFALVLAGSGRNGSLVLENCLVNNVTNLTLIIGLSAVFCRMNIFTGKKLDKDLIRENKANRLNYLSLLFTLIAAFFFTGVVWALARDGSLNFFDGLVLVGLFLFWQVFHVVEVLKSNVRRGKFLTWTMAMDLIIIAGSAYGIYISIEGLVGWVSKAGTGFFIFERLGWLSGWLMVLPNSLLAIYYNWKKRPDIVYSSQVGDGHICIPLCIGLFALFSEIQAPSFLELGVIMILSSTLVHLLCVAVFGRIPKPIGFAFAGAYCFFVFKGLR